MPDRRSPQNIQVASQLRLRWTSPLSKGPRRTENAVESATHCQLYRPTIEQECPAGRSRHGKRPNNLHNPASKPRFLVPPMTCQTIGGQAPRGGIPRHPGPGRPGRGHPFAERAAWVLLWDLSGERARWRLPERSRFAAVPGLNAEDVVPGVRRRATRVTRGSSCGVAHLPSSTLSATPLAVPPSGRSTVDQARPCMPRRVRFGVEHSSRRRAWWQ